MRLDKISNLQLKRIVKIMGIDDLKLITLCNNYGLHQLKNIPDHELAALTAMTDCCKRLSVSRAKQKQYLFYEIQDDFFLLKTDEQQNSVINSIQSKLAAVCPIEFQQLDSIVLFAAKHDLDLVAIMDWIEIEHPFFPCCEITQAQIESYLNHFTENAETYRLLEISDAARIYPNLGHRGKYRQLSTAKF